MQKKIMILLFTLLVFLPVYSQSTGGSRTEPEGFRGIKLGMSVEEVKKILASDSYFDYRGEPDVSFLPEADDILISVEGLFYIKEAFFQFHEERLFTIILVINQEKMDYYTIFTTFQEKYGKYISFSPEKVVWEFSFVLLSLEKPLNIKYMDKEVFKRLQDESRAEDDYNQQSREAFLDEL